MPNSKPMENTVKPIYPGAYPPPSPDDEENIGLPTAPLNLTLGFDLETYQIPLDQLLPSKKVPDGVMTTRKFKQIVASIREIGLIEPLSVIKAANGAGGRDANASIAAYVAETMEGETESLASEVEETGHGTHLDTAETEPADGKGVSLPDGIAPDHGAEPIKAAE